MIEKEHTFDESGTIPLVRTFSTEGKKLKQCETERTYGFEVIDTIKGYDEEGKPYSRYTYVETEEIDEEYLRIQEEESNE